MITISNSVFDAKGADKRDKVFGITLSGNESVTIENCEFKNVGYSAILNKCKNDVVVKDCVFDCSGMYNPIEGAQEVANGNVSVSNCTFNGAPGNNYINFYRVADGSKHSVSGCSFEPTVDNNIVRFSNRGSAVASFSISDCEYTYAPGEPTEYTGFIICQDYTNKNGDKQDFSKYSVNFSNVKCNGEVISAESVAEGCLYYVYEDGAGIITGTNDPVVKFN